MSPLDSANERTFEAFYSFVPISLSVCEILYRRIGFCISTERQREREREAEQHFHVYILNTSGMAGCWVRGGSGDSDVCF